MFLGNSQNELRKVAYLDKYNAQYIYGAGQERPPGAYLNGDIFWILNAGQPFQPNYVGEYCFSSGVSTGQVWASGTVGYNTNTVLTRT